MLLAMAMQPVVGGRRRRTPPSDIERHRIHRARRCAIFTSTPTDQYGVYPQIPPTPLQFEHNHTFYSSSFYNTAYRRASCSLCHSGMPSFFHYCQDCGIVVCRMCSESFRFNSVFYQSYTQDLVSVITWAEDGVVPFRAEHKFVQQRLGYELDSDWGVAAMFEAWEEELYQLQPFMYWDFGTKAFIEEAEHEVQKVYWIVTEENVGLLGRDFQMTFRLDTNRYAPLYWEHHSET
ncbi:hypothetical protein FB567DRAFT_619150 [Paraphoma chrysanthemicola]|uniref:Uncharacterized protein n=1 Tax=Paraphoma chrysanthemicola TaxID=798071 RepID=A0A8K0RA58_9PLEO|nr:hypothetical protein FB567DRAFT_619150 [Paraphoma chrysanthemicola]